MNSITLQHKGLPLYFDGREGSKGDVPKGLYTASQLKKRKMAVPKDLHPVAYVQFAWQKGKKFSPFKLYRTVQFVVDAE